MNLIWKSILYSTIAANFTIFFFGNYNIIASLINFIDDINLYNMIFFFATLMVCMVLNIISIFKLLANQYISKPLMFFLNINNLLNICLIFIGLFVFVLSKSDGGGWFCLICGVSIEVLILGTISYVFSFINIGIIHNLIEKSLNKYKISINVKKADVKENNGTVDNLFKFILKGFLVVFLFLIFTFSFLNIIGSFSLIETVLIFIIHIFSFYVLIWVIPKLIEKSLNKLKEEEEKVSVKIGDEEKVTVKMGDIDMNFIFNRFIFNGFTITCLIISLIIFFLAEPSVLGFEICPLIEVISFIYIALFSLMFSLYNFLHILRNFYLIFTVKTQN